PPATTERKSSIPDLWRNRLTRSRMAFSQKRSRTNLRIFRQLPLMRPSRRRNRPRHHQKTMRSHENRKHKNLSDLPFPRLTRHRNKMPRQVRMHSLETIDVQNLRTDRHKRRMQRDRHRRRNRTKSKSNP